MLQIELINKEHPWWLEVASFAQNVSWKAGSSLANKMRFQPWLSWERVAVARVHGQFTGFCTVTAKDCCPEDAPYSPFIGYVFVQEEFRGRRISQEMISYCCNYAQQLGHSNIYILSGEVGLYEKYGFNKLGELPTAQGRMEQLFVKDICNSDFSNSVFCDKIKERT